MPSSKTIILRFQSKNGQFRLTVDPNTHFTDLFSEVSERVYRTLHVSGEEALSDFEHQILDNLPKDADSRSVTLSNKPFGGEERLLSSLRGVPISRDGLR